MPSRFADERELQGLAKAMGDGGKGVFMITKGTKTSVGFLEGLAALSGRPVLVAALLHSDTQPDLAFDDMAAIHAARARGHALYGQVSCLPLTMDLTIKSPYPFESVAAWKPAMQVGEDVGKLKAIYRDPSFRAAVRTGLDQRRGLQGFSNQWDKVRVSKIHRPENAALEGRDLAALAQERGLHPLDVMLDIGLSEELETIFSMAMMNSNEAAVAKLISDEAAHIALSDAGAHLSFLCDADFGPHLLGHWVRERGVMSLEAAVHKLTKQVADIFGIRRRGCLAVGNQADLLLFDPARVASGARRRVADMPAGGQRLTTAALGLHGTWVNGRQIAGAAGLLPNAPKAGTVLRDFAA
jgi:N-acyl-D-aspartate/D-glutamate deacylase